MNKDVARRWVDALRSGKYKQTTHRLAIERNGEVSYCCLGVLCELAVEDGVIPPKTPRDYYGEYEFDGDVSIPSLAVQEWSGLGKTGEDDYFVVPLTEEARERIGVQGDYSTGHLPTLNDYLGFTFEDIANLIEHAYLND
jgi:hypothetical protein